MIKKAGHIRRFMAIGIAALCCEATFGQTEATEAKLGVRDTLVQQPTAAQGQLIDVVAEYPSMPAENLTDVTPVMTLQMPAYPAMTLPGYRPFLFPSIHPYMFGAPMSAFWELHDGFNVNLEAGVSVGLGKHNLWHGASFFTHLTGVYAQPINDRLTLAAGATYSRYTGWGRGLNGLSVFGLANYRINERLDITGYLSHDFRPGFGQRYVPGSTPYMPGFGGQATTIGADLGIKVGENAKINVGVSFTREEQPGMMPMSHQRSATPLKDFDR